MGRLLRPSIPLALELRVLCRQLGEMFADDVVAIATEARSLGTVVVDRKERLAALLGCKVEDLRLDHDPALVNREKIMLLDGAEFRGVVRPKGAKVLRYFPDANDPEYLAFRPHQADAAGSHDVKTRIRGDRGQLSDLALARKAKRAAKKAEGRPRPKRSAMLLPKAGGRQTAQGGKKGSMGGAGRGKLRGRGFPPKGSRKFGRKA